MTITAIRPKVFSTESPALEELFRQRKALDEQIAKINNAIMLEVLKTPAYSFIKGIAGGSVPTGIIEANCITFELNAYNLDQRLTKTSELSPAYRPTPADRIAQLGEKTLNSLLNGKTLNAAEKRKLVSAMLPDGILNFKGEAAEIDGDAA
jgi:hypothetical protein